MSDNVVDAVGPVLQRIQLQLNRLEEKIDTLSQRMEPRLGEVEKTVSGLILRHRYTLGAVSDMDALMKDFDEELAQLRGRVTALESR